MIRFRGVGILAPWVYVFAIPFISLLGAPYREPNHGDPRFWCITGLATVAGGVIVFVFGLLLNRGRADSQGNVPHDLMGCSVEAWGLLGIVLGIIAQPVAGVLLVMNWIDPPIPPERMLVTKRLQDLKSNHAITREMSANRLAELGEEAKAAIPALTEAMMDESEQVRDAAEKALAVLEPAGIAKRKEQAAAAKEVWAKKKQHAERQIEIREAIQNLRSKDANYREFAAKKLGMIGPDAAEAIPLLKELLEDRDLTVRAVAEEALAVLQPDGVPAIRWHVKDSLRTLRKAMFGYEARYKYSFDPKDKIIPSGLSWRVLLLPHLGEEALFLKFKLDEPWDSAANLPLVAQMPKVYAPPRTGVAVKPGHTHLQMFVEAKDVAGGATPSVRSVVSPLSRGVADCPALWVVEACVAVPWTKPADLPIAKNWPLPPLGHAMPNAFGALFRFDRQVDFDERREDIRFLSSSVAAKYRQHLTVFRPAVDWTKFDFKILKPETHPAKETGTLQGNIRWRDQPLTTGWIALVTDDGREYASPFDANGGYRIIDAPVGRGRIEIVLGRADVPMSDWLRSGESVQVRPGLQNHDLRLE